MANAPKAGPDQLTSLWGCTLFNVECMVSPLDFQSKPTPSLNCPFNTGETISFCQVSQSSTSLNICHTFSTGALITILFLVITGASA